METLLLERRDRIGTLTLNRPEKLNAMTPALIAEFSDALTEIEKDREIRVLIIRGAGRAFSTGYDLTGGWGGDSTTKFTIDDDQRFLQRYVEHWLRLRDLPKPVIAMVHGYCLAGATQLCISSDIIFVADNAQIGFPSIPAGAGYVSSFWNWMVGPHRTKYLAFLPGSRISGKEAEAMGFATAPSRPISSNAKPTITPPASPKSRRKSSGSKNSRSTARWICGVFASPSKPARNSTRFSTSVPATRKSAPSRRSAACAAPSNGTRKNNSISLSHRGFRSAPHFGILSRSALLSF